MAFKDPDWTWHCADHAISAVEAETGRDVWAELGGRPDGWSGAAKLYRSHGCRSLADLVTIVLGEPIDRRWARRGDIAMVDGALGVIRGELVEFVDRMQPISRVTLAWQTCPRSTSGAD